MRRLVIPALALAALLVQASSAISAEGRRWADGYIPNLPVVDQQGRTLRFYDDVIKGKIVVVSFIYTSCKDICPLITARLAQVAERLGDRMGRNVHFVSISVDPKTDTPERLGAHAAAFHAGPGWTFLTGDLADIKAINGRLGEKMRSLSEHRTEIVLGNDATGEWARNSVFGDMNRLVMDILAMDPEWRDRPHAVQSAQAGEVGYKLELPPGQALFKRMCAGCHAFKVGDSIGPDLYGVTRRRTRTWLVDFIMSPDKMIRQNDPAAVALLQRFPGVRMPNLGLTEVDANDLVVYIEHQTTRLDTDRVEAERAMPAHGHHDHRRGGGVHHGHHQH